MDYAVISADVVSSTSLSLEAWETLIARLRGELLEIEHLAHNDGCWGRLVKGDTIECVFEQPRFALRSALLLKTSVKSFRPSGENVDKKFKRLGMRIALGYGTMRIVNRDLDIMDGEAIYSSGRALAAMGTKTRDTFEVAMKDERREREWSMMTYLLNMFLNRTTYRQSETLHYKLLGNTNAEIAKKMKISAAGVSQNLNFAGWGGIEKTLRYFEETMAGCASTAAMARC